MHKRWWIMGGIVMVGVVAVAVVVLPKTALKDVASSSAVTWQLREGNVWVSTGSPPPCPEPLVVTSPVDMAQVSGILYPGQPRGEAWKPQGAFRFAASTHNNVLVKVPFDAQVIRGSRAFRMGENQYAFEFSSPCGVWYSFGHLLELAPKFQAIADRLPLIDDDKDGFHVQQFFDVTPPVSVTTGEVIATRVGYAKSANAFVDWNVLDLRHKNGVQLRPEWAKYQNEVDEYAICWLDILPAADREHLLGLFGSGDHETGTKSDYCHYPQNR